MWYEHLLLEHAEMLRINARSHYTSEYSGMKTSCRKLHK